MDTSFGGPDGSKPLPASERALWKQGTVRGHMPGPRGAWDLVGGALKVLIGPRLTEYVSGESEAPASPETGELARLRAIEAAVRTFIAAEDDYHNKPDNEPTAGASFQRIVKARRVVVSALGSRGEQPTAWDGSIAIRRRKA